jgi:hypothetical protein
VKARQDKSQISQDQIKLLKEQFENERGPYYTKQCDEWMQQDLHKYFLAFVLCGQPGKKFSSLDVSIEFSNNSKGSRRAAITASAIAKSSSTAITISSFSQQQTSLTIQEKAIQTKEREVSIQERAYMQTAKRHEIEDMQLYLTLNQNKNCNKRKKVQERLMNVLYNSISFDDEPELMVPTNSSNCTVAMTPLGGIGEINGTNHHISIDDDNEINSFVEEEGSEIEI